jgi:hypothetical protein
MYRPALFLGLLTSALISFVPALGQNASGSLDATVYDASGAVVPHAKIALKNEATGATSETTSNSVGFFSIPAIQPASYALTISAPGFAVWERANIVFSQGENRTLPDIALQVGGVTEKVHVVASAPIAPLETGEIRQTLDSNMVMNVPIEGRNAAELIKIMPGMATNSGLSQYPWTSQVTQSNSGPAGQYVANGTQPWGSMTITSDGANLLDPGNQGTQVANINQDQTAEVTVLTSAFGAEYAKGPVTFQAVGKSGTSAFHGALYLYAAGSAFDSEDSYFKSLGFRRGETKENYLYPGGEIGGPVLIPGVRFNRKRDKMFFYIAPEGMDQPVIGLSEAFVPTAQMLQGNFSPQYLASLGAGFASAYAAYAVAPTEHGAAAAYPGGIIPAHLLDPTSLAYVKSFPQTGISQVPNATGNNFITGLNEHVNRFEFRVRTDYTITDNTRLFVTWNRQDEFDLNPIGVWYYPGSALPYPSGMPAHQVSNILSGNVVHVFGPAMTNETVFAVTRFLNPVRLADAAEVNPAMLGLSGYQPLAPDPYVPQPPNVAGVAGYYAPAFGTAFQGGDFGKLSLDPSVADNLSRVVGSHALKFGAYWDFAENQQPGGLGNFPQGLVVFGNTGADTSGNVMADFLTGRVQSFQQVPALSVYDLKQSQYSLYAQDQWKVTRKLTLTYGVRLDHIGQWYPTSGPGLAVWNPATYNDTSAAGPWTGLLWHGIDNNIPMSGFPSKPFFVLPRLGMAWDVFGHGRTVLRGGFGGYRYQISFGSAVNGGVYDEPAGIPSYTLTNPANLGWNFAQYGLPSAAAGLGGNIAAMQQGDSRTPYTESYDFIVSQTLPWKSILEVEYSGNQSHDLLLSGNGANIPYLGNMNKTPAGAYFLPDPVTGVVNDPATGAIPYQDYRPYKNYQTMLLVSHGSYQNYNALMASWNKQSGPATFMLNYTFGKVLGTRDGESDNGATNGYSADPWNLRDNYGVLPYDHTQILNAAYVVHVPFQIHGGDPLLRGVANGWVISGATRFQSGAPIQPNTGGNMYLNTTGGLNSQMWLGTDSEEILPVLTCDPRSNLKSGQYFNPNCFALGPRGTNGPAVWPDIKGPAYFNSDLSVQKEFHIGDHPLELRISAFNFLNHPLRQFTGADTELKFAAPVAGTTNSNALTTGYPLYIVGYRVVLLTIKYRF